MNQTSGQGFNNSFGVSLTQGQPRNSVVGSRHIPIAKFSRGGRRAGGANADATAKRVTSINFYQNGHGQSHKLKNALDISLNKIEGGKKSTGNTLNSSMLNESMQSAQSNNIFIGNKKGAQAYMTRDQVSMYANGTNPNSVYATNQQVMYTTG